MLYVHGEVEIILGGIIKKKKKNETIGIYFIIFFIQRYTIKVIYEYI